MVAIDDILISEAKNIAFEILSLNDSEGQNLASEEDKFGLKTDSKGNVIAEGEEFLKQAFSIEGYRYFGLADFNHDSENEDNLLRDQASLLKNLGFNHAFLEFNEVELGSMKSEIKKYFGGYNNQSDAVDALEENDIKTVASDTRVDKANKYTEEIKANMSIYNAYGLTVNLSVAMQEDVSISSNLTEFIDNYRSEKNLSDGDINQIAAYFYSKSSEVFDKMTVGDLEVNDINKAKAAAFLSMGKAIDGSNSYIYTTESTIIDISKDIQNEAMNAIMEATRLTEKETAEKLKRADEQNKNIVTKIKSHDLQGGKGLIVYGSRHFANKGGANSLDIDDEIDMIVIGTAANSEELNSYLQNLGSQKDPVDYIYNSETGKAISTEKFINKSERGASKGTAPLNIPLNQVQSQESNNRQR